MRTCPIISLIGPGFVLRFTSQKSLKLVPLRKSITAITLFFEQLSWFYLSSFQNKSTTLFPYSLKSSISCYLLYVSNNLEYLVLFSTYAFFLTTLAEKKLSSISYCYSLLHFKNLINKIVVHLILLIFRWLGPEAPGPARARPWSAQHWQANQASSHVLTCGWSLLRVTGLCVPGWAKSEPGSSSSSMSVTK